MTTGCGQNIQIRNKVSWDSMGGIMCNIARQETWSGLHSRNINAASDFVTTEN